MAYKNNVTKIESNIFSVEDEVGKKRYIVRVKDPRQRWYPQQTFTLLFHARSYRNQLILKRESRELVSHAARVDIGFAEYWEIWSEDCRGGGE